MIRVIFFASIREAVGRDEVELDGDFDTVRDVITGLAGTDEQCKAALAGENLLMAVNQTMVEPDHPVKPGDEVAFFPPVTGG